MWLQEWVSLRSHTHPEQDCEGFSGNFSFGMSWECLMHGARAAQLGLGQHGERAHLEPAHPIWAEGQAHLGPGGTSGAGAAHLELAQCGGMRSCPGTGVRAPRSCWFLHFPGRGPSAAV